MSLTHPYDEAIRTDQSYWQREANLRLTRPSLIENYSAEFVIIGGGFAGLTTANAILEQKPGSEIVILESEYIGFGASGRACGLMGPIPAPVWVVSADSNNDHLWGLRHANQKMHQAAEWVRQTLPDAQCVKTPLRVRGMGPLSSAVLERATHTFEHSDIDFESLPNESKGRWLSFTMAAHTIHPVRLASALARHAEGHGIQIFENTAVDSVAQDGNGAKVHLDNGCEVTARTVIACTNAYSSYISGLGRVRARPVYTYMLASEPLDQDSIDQIEQSNAFTYEMSKEAAYYRLHGDRILFGALDKSSNENAGEFQIPDAIMAELTDLFYQTFPDLKKVQFQDAWSGQYHLSLTDLPIIRRVDTAQSVVLNVAYGGTGIALAFICAPLAASLAIGSEFNTPEDERLYKVITNTRTPVMSGIHFAGNVTAALIRASLLGHS